MKPSLVFDCEIYRDYFLLSFLNPESGNVRHFELFEDHPFEANTVRLILSKYRCISFNGIGFDLPLVTMALGGATNEQIKAASDRIIKNNVRPWQMGLDSFSCDHVDLIEVAPGIASLKIYGGRLHCPRLQDLPIDPDASIAPEQRPVLREYCTNDLHTTLALFRRLEPQIKLREQMSEQYGVDLRSKSDAQIAEAVIKAEVSKRMGRPLQKPGDLSGTVFRYRPPKFLAFDSAPLAEAFDIVRQADFTVLGNGTVKMPPEIASLKIRIGTSTYRMGIGGLHSSEKSIAHIADAQTILRDVDVASYYPAIILNCGLRPAHMGEHFTKVYRSIVQRRLEAKRSGDKVAADALKITINGSFGKFGSPYSLLYSPTLLIQTTVTGQLALLMLIEALEAEGIPVVSANTDGLVIKCPRNKIGLMEFIVWEWEEATKFETEATDYLALYSRDVNNYIAIKADGFKVKGAYAPPVPVGGSWPNPGNQICKDAVIKFLQDGTAVAETIIASRDITKFVTIRQVKGGAVKGDAYLGRAVRWYYARGESGTINYKVNGYTVPRTEGARPLMDLPAEFPNDVDFGWYIAEAESILNDIGAKHAQPTVQPQSGSLPVPALA